LIDENDVFDFITVLSKPKKGLSLFVSKDTIDTANAALKGEPGDSVNYNFVFSFDSTLETSISKVNPFVVYKTWSLVIFLN